MKSLSFKRVLSPFLFALAVGSMLHCGDSGDDETFTSSGDTAVMSGIVGTWSGTSAEGHSYTLTLCEDAASNDTRDTFLGCENLHTVRGNGLGANETVSEPTGGCGGGCVYYSGAFVTGTIVGDDLKSTVIYGEFALANGDNHGQPFPYDVSLHDSASDMYTTQSQGVTIYATMEGPGVIDTVSFTYPAASTPIEDAAVDAQADSDAGDSSTNGALAVTFKRVGDTTCPSP